MKIAVLHARQLLTTSLAEVFPGDECLLLTAGDGAAVREDVRAASGVPVEVSGQGRDEA